MKKEEKDGQGKQLQLGISLVQLYYVFLWIAFTLVVYDKRETLAEMKELQLNNLYFVVWFILLLMPFIQEIDFLGFTIKKDMRKDMREMIVITFGLFKAVGGEEEGSAKIMTEQGKENMASINRRLRELADKYDVFLD